MVQFSEETKVSSVHSRRQCTFAYIFFFFLDRNASPRLLMFPGSPSTSEQNSKHGLRLSLKLTYFKCSGYLPLILYLGMSSCCLPVKLPWRLY
ncbi:hypothetical protein BDW75DRAFT_44175 [Aspergillus navahoensis]